MPEVSGPTIAESRPMPSKTALPSHHDRPTRDIDGDRRLAPPCEHSPNRVGPFGHDRAILATCGVCLLQCRHHPGKIRAVRLEARAWPGGLALRISRLFKMICSTLLQRSCLNQLLTGKFSSSSGRFANVDFRGPNLNDAPISHRRSFRVCIVIVAPMLAVLANRLLPPFNRCPVRMLSGR